MADIPIEIIGQVAVLTLAGEPWVGVHGLWCITSLGTSGAGFPTGNGLYNARRALALPRGGHAQRSSADVQIVSPAAKMPRDIVHRIQSELGAHAVVGGAYILYHISELWRVLACSKATAALFDVLEGKKFDDVGGFRDCQAGIDAAFIVS